MVCRGLSQPHRKGLPLRNTVIVFARAPRLGAVKRRLAAGIGAVPALRFYRGVLFWLLRALARDRRFRTVVALTPDRARVRWPVRLPVIGQGEGDLAARMGRACARFRRGRVVIIGSDIPDAGPSDVAGALHRLGNADAVFGPARDGGYWLAGLGCRRPQAPFGHVRWSSEHALADTRRNFAGRRTALLRTLQDIDTSADLKAWLA